jgi:hypothetical protein
MYASVEKQEIPTPWLFRFCGRVGGLVVLVTWLGYVAVELIRSGAPVLENYFQGVMLAIVFIGYIAGWRYELLGGALTIVGTIGFIALYVTMFHTMPLYGAAWFAFPGVCFILAHYLESPSDERASSET